jgi:hypothetical protein
MPAEDNSEEEMKYFSEVLKFIVDLVPAQGRYQVECWNPQLLDHMLSIKEQPGRAAMDDPMAELRCLIM